MSKILFIGGTGIISSACSELAIEAGHELFLLNRGVTSGKRAAPAGATLLRGDYKQEAETMSLLDDYQFDAVVNWIGFTPQDVERDLRLFGGRVSQYVFISSASAYQKPVRQLPISEDTPLENPYWEYSRNKIACEEKLRAYHEAGQLPVTIVRPSHTYDKTLLPFQGGYTVIDRMKQGKPVVVHGDGTSLWVLTHHRDFASGFVPLLGNASALGEAFHITSDMLLSWNQIFEITAAAFDVHFEPLYVPSTVIANYDPDWGASLLGDKTYSVIFDNSKIKSFVPGYEARIPFSQGIQEIAAWYQSSPENQQVDPHYSKLVDKIVREQSR